MKDKVTIDIKTLQRVDGEEEVTMHSYNGRSKEQETGLEVVYRHEEQGRVIQTNLLFTEAGCRMISSGGMERTMDFFPGTKSKTLLKLPMGTLEFEVHTAEYDMERITEGETELLKARIVYSLHNAAGHIADNELDVRVRG